MEGTPRELRLAFLDKGWNVMEIHKMCERNRCVVLLETRIEKRGEGCYTLESKFTREEIEGDDYTRDPLFIAQWGMLKRLWEHVETHGR